MLIKKLAQHLFLLVLQAAIATAAQATVNVTGTISQDTDWTSDNVYLVTGDVTIGQGIKLTIHPGTIVKFNSGRQLNVNQGILIAQGDFGNEIIFTSYRDDSAGGDTNGDGPSQGQPGDWQSVAFNNAVPCAGGSCEAGESGTILSNCRLRYGKLHIYRSDIIVDSCEITNSASQGIYSQEASPFIRNTRVAQSRGAGIYVYYGNPQITACLITGGNGDGVYVNYASPAFENNTISDNQGWGLYYETSAYGGETPPLAGNTITGNVRSMMIPASAMPDPQAASEDINILAPNTINGIWIRGNTRSLDMVFPILYPDTGHEINSYQIYNTLTMAADTRLTVEPGVTVKFYTGADLYINGGLDAEGTVSRPVVFTSYRDDQYGGDLNLDGYSSTPAGGDWGGIAFSAQADGSASVIDHAVVRYGGSENSGMIYAYDADISVTNSVISNSGTNGIRAYAASLTLSGNEIFGNSGDGLNLNSSGTHAITSSRIFANLGDGLEVGDSVAVTVTGCEIFGNQGLGLNRTQSSPEAAARGNWWGAASGPGGQAPGAGDQVSADVDYQGYLTTGANFSYFNAGPNTSEGTIQAPTVIQGTDTAEYGTDDRTRMLYDLNRVILNYSAVDPGAGYDLFVTYANGDNASGVGGNIQSLTDQNGSLIHNSLTIPDSSAPSQYRYSLPASAHDTGMLELNFNRESGYRAVVSQVWLVQRASTGDTAGPASAVSIPAASDQLAGSTVMVSGTSSDEGGSGVLCVEVGVDGGSGIKWHPATHLSANGSWQYQWTLPADGAYTLYTRAFDRAGNQGAVSSGLAVVVNNTAPEAVTGLSAWDTPEDSGSAISLSWTLSPDDGNDVAGYTILRSEDPDINFSAAGSVGAGVSAFQDTAAVDGGVYYYRVAARDLAGNETLSGACGPVTAIDNSGGSDELPPEEITGLSAAPGNGFVYLTWTPSADTRMDLVDQILEMSSNNGTDWTSGISLGKDSRFYLARNLSNGTGYLFRIKVRDSSGNTSTGTQAGPVTPDTTAVTTVSGHITSDATWAAGVYEVSGAIFVDSGATLTILPGVIVKFRSGTYMEVNGTLIADGDPGSEVVFTAWTDDAYGGDSNADGSETRGAPGYWRHLSLTAASSANSILEHAVIRYAGYYNDAAVYLYSDAPMIFCQVTDNAATGLRTDSNAPLIQHNTFENNGADGIFFHYGSPSFSDNTVSDNGGNGVYVQYAVPVMDNNTITGNTGYGIYCQDARQMPEITDNTITGNAFPVRLALCSLPGPNAGNTLAPNTHNQIEFYGNTLDRSLTLAADPVNVYYQVSGEATVNTGVRLTLEPGVIWKMGDGTRLNVNGALYAVGTEENTIAFTSYRDDSAGGDTNNDGYSEGAPGDWYRIYFSDSVIDFLARLEYVDVRYAGRYNYNAIHLNQANVTIDHCRITNNACRGIYAYYAAPLIRNTRVADNADTGISLYYSNASLDGNTISDNGGDGVDADASSPVVTGNTLTGNAGWGLCYTSSSNAENTPPLTGNAITGNARSMMIPASAMPDPQAPEEDINILAPNSVNGIWIQGNTRNLDLVFGLLYAGTDHEISTYQIYNTLTMPRDVKLTVAPGVTVKFYANADLDINGSLDAKGTVSRPVVFTSYRDDRYGGDLNLDGYSSAPANGDWGSIAFSAQADGSACVFDHAVVRYGGSEDSGMLYTSGTNISVTNSIISNSATDGIRATGASLALSENEIFGNNGDGIYLYSSGSHTIDGSRIFANFGDGLEVRDSVAVAVTGCEIFGNQGLGLNRTQSSPEAAARGNWWGAASGPGGQAPGAGDQVTSDVDYQAYLTTGSNFSYFNAGPNTGEGTIQAPAATQGTDTSEYGTDDRTRMLYDLNRVILDYSAVDPGAGFDLFVTYANGDNASGVGGNIQSLTDQNGSLIHNDLTIPDSSHPSQYRYSLPASSHDTGTLKLIFNKESGYRAVVSQVWLVQRASTGDTSGPSSAISSPAPAEHLAGSLAVVTGTSSDETGSGVLNVELGVDGGSGIKWHPVTQLSANGSWQYRWALPADGAYTLYTRAFDRAGNQGAVSSGLAVVVNNTAPEAVTGLSAWDTPEDSGSAISLSWTLSPDDGNDVAGYTILRSEDPDINFSAAGSVGAGVSAFQDTAAVNGGVYYYRVAARDLAGNETLSGACGPVTAIDNSGGSDELPPEEITGLSAAPGNGFVYLTWTPSADTRMDLVDQILEMSSNNGTDWTSGISLGKDSRFYLARNLSNGTGYLFRIKVRDSSGNTSTGTQAGPVTPDTTAVTTVSGHITSDATWAAGVYEVSGAIFVDSGATLTILPGVIVKFRSGTYMEVNGTLIADGDPGSEVVFTAWTDDAYGGDSNADGSETRGAPGYWRHLSLTAASSANSILEHAVIRYAGYYNDAAVYLYSDAPMIFCQVTDNAATGLRTDSNAPLIQHNTFENNGADGIFFHYGSPSFSDNTVSDNGGNGVYVQYAVPVMDNNTITGNTGYGIYCQDARQMPEITDNTITGNAFPVRLALCSLPGPNAGNTLAPNTHNQIEFYGNTLDRSLTLAADPVNVYYQVSGEATVNTGVRLTLEPGVI